MNVKICSHLSNDMINCDLSYSKILPAGVVNIDGKKTSKGDFYLSWTYAKHSVEILDLKNTSSQITESVPNDF